MLDKKILTTALFCIAITGANLYAQDVNTTPPKAGNADNMELAPASDNERVMDNTTSPQPVVNATPPLAGDEPASEQITGSAGDERTSQDPINVPVQTINASPPKAPEN